MGSPVISLSYYAVWTVAGRPTLIALTAAWWSLVLISSGDAPSADWTRSLLADWLGLRGAWLEAATYAVRKGAHVAYYGVLAWLLAACAAPRLASPARAAVVAGLLSLGTGVFDEVRQSFSAVRTGSAVDVAYDAVGILAATAFYARRASAR